jgi:hypothetical protein
MFSTYKAILKGNRLEWTDETPAQATDDHPIVVHVTILEEVAGVSANVSQGERMAAALEQLAAAHALVDITEPAAWERELRQDRSLPDRDT